MKKKENPNWWIADILKIDRERFNIFDVMITEHNKFECVASNLLLEIHWRERVGKPEQGVPFCLGCLGTEERLLRKHMI